MINYVQLCLITSSCVSSVLNANFANLGIIFFKAQNNTSRSGGFFGVGWTWGYGGGCGLLLVALVRLVFKWKSRAWCFLMFFVCTLRFLKYLFFFNRAWFQRYTRIH